MPTLSLHPCETFSITARPFCASNLTHTHVTLKPGETAQSKVVSREFNVFSALPLSPINICICDIHLQRCFFFICAVIQLVCVLCVNSTDF